MNQLINILTFLTFFLFSACHHHTNEAQELEIGADRQTMYVSQLEGKHVALLVNHTSLVKEGHLVDVLLKKDINVKKIFSPEHGFRGKADAGEKLTDSKDPETGLPVISLYGKNRKPTPGMLEGLDVVVFDIQDVGVRFYTYISTMHYMMEACAENGVKMIVLDRPNPNGYYVDGPVREPEFRSFVGMHPIPVVHGMTVGEIARMINGEKWLEGGVKCDLTVVPVKNYTHGMRVPIRVKPSPNLPNDRAVNLYPSLCFFEGTRISVGRGTHFPFQVAGYPDFAFGAFSFTPESIDGMAKHPKLEEQKCYGIDLRKGPPLQKLELKYLIEFYNKWKEKEDFFNKFFNKLAGNEILQQQIREGLTEEQIRDSWEDDLKVFKQMRKKYLLYTDFEK